MEGTLISLKVAKLAKEKKFDWKVLNCYNENGEIGDVEDYLLINFNQWENVEGSNINLYSTPTQSLLQKWIREVHKIHILIDYGNLTNKYCFELLPIEPKIEVFMSSEMKFKTYEEALEAALLEVLKLIK